MSTKRRGHVRQRGDTFTAYWRARDEDGRSVQRSKGGFKKADDAERHLTKVLRDLDTGAYVEPDRKARTQTFAQFVRDDWLPAIKVERKPSTFSSYRSTLELHVIPAIGTLRLPDIKTERLSALYGELLEGGRRRGSGRGLSPTSVRYTHVVIRTVLKHAVAWNRIARNPADGAILPSARRTEMQVWSALQLRRFLGHVRDDRLYAAFLLACTTGMRRGEILGLRWQDVNLETGQVNVSQTLVQFSGGEKVRTEVSTPKTEQSRRRVGLDPTTLATLKAHRARQAAERLAWGEAWTDSGLVFTQEDGNWVSPAALSREFLRQAKTAGLPRIRFHDLRHSYATAAIEAGVPTKVVSGRLGHARTGITEDRYQHVLPGVDDEAAARVAAVILG